jgi:hypothetical protein
MERLAMDTPKGVGGDDVEEAAWKKGLSGCPALEIGKCGKAPFQISPPYGGESNRLTSA